MQLTAGARLGPYEIGAPLGSGGMGEVYRARDTRLDRSVALKIVSLDVAGEPEAAARFSREARLISRVAHPNICALYDVGESDGMAFLVMEYLEGETLAARLQHGPLPIAQAVSVGGEIALALDAAHRRGIVHRDLKPGNVMLTRAGVKLLDFGIAAAIGGGRLASGAETTAPVTRPGLVAGTPLYMAPEQVRGEAADHRADLFSLGVLLHEMITGERVFADRSHADTMAAVLSRQVPRLSSRQPSVPAILDHLADRCLAKDPDGRWQSARDVASQLRWIGEGGTTGAVAPTASATMRPRRRTVMAALCGVAAGAAVAAIASTVLRSPVSPVMPVLRATVPLPATAQLAAARPSVAISPDGRFLAFVASTDGAMDGTTRLYVRPVDAFETTPVKGTDGATGPFFSPDGEWLGFVANGRLQKVPRLGGAPVDVAEAPDLRGASWGSDGTIVFAPRLDSGLYRLSSAGGVPTPVTTLAADRREKTHRFPDLLPDGKTVMFTAATLDIATFDEATIAVQPLAGGAPTTIITGGAAARYLPSGHIVYARSDALLAVPFDLRRLEVTGPAVTVADGVAFANDYGRVEYDVSDTGTLVYLPGGDTSQRSALVSVDRRGVFVPLTSQPRLFLSVEFSPTSQSLLTIIGGANDTAWIYDTPRDVPSRLTFKGINSASWTPDGRRVLYTRAAELGSIAADGSGTEEVLYREDTQIGGPTLTPDGATLLFQIIRPDTGYDIWMLDTATGRTAPWMATAFREGRPRISPDGRWVSYVSNESGRSEVYVRALHDQRIKTRVSRDGGLLPTWSADGRELFFLGGLSIFAAAVTTDAAAFRAGVPTPLFTLRRKPADDGAIYDVAPDGRSFVVVEPLTTFAPAVANLVTGWSADIGRMVRSK